MDPPVCLSLTNVGDYLGLAATVVGLSIGAVTLLGFARSWFRRTIGRRRDRYARLRRLGINAQLAFFTSVLGEPPAVRRTMMVQMPDYEAEMPEDADWEEWEHPIAGFAFTECFFIDRDYYVQTISDHDDTVVAFSVTTRNRRFAPRFRAIPRPSLWQRLRWRLRGEESYWEFFELRLGHTRFSDVMKRTGLGYSLPELRPSLGARTYSYSEVHYFGNPGYYQHYVFTASSVAGRFPRGDILTTTQEGLRDEWMEVVDPEIRPPPRQS